MDTEYLFMVGQSDGGWWDTGGKSGKADPRQAFFDTLDRWYLSVTEEEYQKSPEAWVFKPKFVSIGTVGMVQCPVIITNGLRNVPEKSSSGVMTYLGGCNKA